MNSRLTLATIVVGLLAGAAGTLQAQGLPDRHDREFARPGGPGLRIDDRYHHDHYYPPHGDVVGALPAGSLGLSFGGGRYFFHGGVWFRPSGGRYVVVAPPLGIVVPLLPPSYVTLTIGGAPYYYANGTYYAVQPGQGYAVVAPPPGADAAQPVASGEPMPQPLQQAQDQPPSAAAPVAPIVYPRNGQSAAQTESDRRECNRWAATQPSAAGDASVFQRAVSACMDGRGYTLR